MLKRCLSKPVIISEHSLKRWLRRGSSGLIAAALVLKGRETRKNFPARRTWWQRDRSDMNPRSWSILREKGLPGIVAAHPGVNRRAAARAGPSPLLTAAPEIAPLAPTAPEGTPQGAHATVMEAARVVILVMAAAAVTCPGSFALAAVVAAAGPRVANAPVHHVYRAVNVERKPSPCVESGI